MMFKCLIKVGKVHDSLPSRGAMLDIVLMFDQNKCIMFDQYEIAVGWEGWCRFYSMMVNLLGIPYVKNVRCLWLFKNK